VAVEVAEHLPAWAERRVDAALLLAALSVMPVDWQPPEAYEPHRTEAERRMAGRDPEDWPTVAVALARSLPIWSQDKDLQVAGLTVCTTGELLEAMRGAGRS
jgi:predicted nucleic acid-binding protein